MSNWNWGGSGASGFGDDDDEDDNPYQGYSATKDQLILLIDCTKKMFEVHNEEEEVPFELCVKCAKSVLLNKIVSSDKDMVGVVFFGTEKHKNQSDFKHVYIFQDIDTPDANSIKSIEEILASDDFGDFSTVYGHNGGFSLNDVLWTCSDMLAKSVTRSSHKRILLFTATDHPHQANPALQRQAKTKAKDMSDNGIEIELMHIGSSFDVSLFYQDIIVTGDEDITMPNPAEKFEELLTRVRSKEFKRRTMQRLSLTLGPGVEIGVGVYCLVREAKKPSFVRLDQRKNEDLKTHTKMICEDTGTELMPQDIKYYQELGGEKAIFEKEETVEIKKLVEKGLTLMGFKPLSKLKIEHYVKPASFIYPEEGDVRGSSQLFSALLTRCLARKVMGICQFAPTVSAAPRLVALVPQKEELDENNVQVTPPGFHVVFLPFADELRKLTLEEMPKAETAEIDKAKAIIKKLTFNYESNTFENPVLQTHYRYLEAIALQHESVEPITDLTIPDKEMMSKRAGKLLEEFKELVYPPGYDPEKPVKKRKATTEAGGGAGGGAKRAKTTAASAGSVDIPTLAKDGKLNSATVATLKEYMKSVKLKTTGKKQDLIDAITEHLGL